MSSETAKEPGAEVARATVSGVAERVHFVGVGGIGMSGLAICLADSGCQVTGSDAVGGAALRRVADHGIEVHEGHDAAHLPARVDRLVRSVAVPDSNPEVAAARARGIPVQSYAQALAALAGKRRVVAVAGSHGKTTTTAMTALILREAGLDPGLLVGGLLPELGGENSRLGSGAPFVLEACEYQASFHAYHPHAAIVTNVGSDHVESYGSLDGLRQGFRQFVGQIDPGGLLVTTAALSRDLDFRGAARCRIVGVGPKRRDWRIDVDEDGEFRILSPDGRKSPRFALLIPGRHNILNATMASLLAAEAFGVDLETAGRALSTFRGVARRFEIHREGDDLTIVDDYAHHPTEIEATLLAARERYPRRRLVVVFQPHLEERTRRHFPAFLNALAIADQVVLLRDTRVTGRDGESHSSARSLHDALRRLHQPSQYFDDRSSCIEGLVRLERPGDVVMTMGAGDVGAISGELATRLR